MATIMRHSSGTIKEPYFRLPWLNDSNLVSGCPHNSGRPGILTKMSETVPDSDQQKAKRQKRPAEPGGVPKPRAEKNYPAPSVSETVTDTDLRKVKRQTRPAEPRGALKSRAEKLYPDLSVSETVPETAERKVKRMPRPAEPRGVPKPRTENVILIQATNRLQQCCDFHP